MTLLGFLVDSAAGAHEKLHCLRLGLIHIVEGCRIFKTPTQQLGNKNAVRHLIVLESSSPREQTHCWPLLISSR